MKVALTQMDVKNGRISENLQTLEDMTSRAAKEGCAYIFFPEMTLTGYTVTPEKVYKEEDAATPKILALSKALSIGIGRGYIKKNEDGEFENRYMLVKDGEIKQDYSKLHPFSYSGESECYAAGKEIVADSEIGLMICYDLRFPLAFQLASKEAPIISVAANWPIERVDHWFALLRARAIENQCFILGTNRCGIDGEYVFSKSSVAFDPYGKRLTPESEEDLLIVEIDPEDAYTYRKEFPLRADRNFGILSQIPPVS